jgi:hypothetical protein
MASIVREAAIEIPAARCWAAVRAFDALHERLGGFCRSSAACRRGWSLARHPICYGPGTG